MPGIWRSNGRVWPRSPRSVYFGSLTISWLLTLSRSHADLYGGFYSGKNDHAAFWTTLQRLLPQFKSKEYTDFQRGRVLYDSMEAIFLVYSSREIVNSPGLRKLILTEFKLPLRATKFQADYHYESVILPMLDEDFEPKIDVNNLRRVLQFQGEQRRGRLAIIALLHARVDQLCGWNRTSRVLD
jgi:hypothetical protein